MAEPLIQRLTSQLQARGYDQPRETAISLLQKHGNLDPQGELTGKGMKRQLLGPDGRARDRAARQSNGRHTADEYTYSPKTNRATL